MYVFACVNYHLYTWHTRARFVCCGKPTVLCRGEERLSAGLPLSSWSHVTEGDTYRMLMSLRLQGTKRVLQIPLLQLVGN